MDPFTDSLPPDAPPVPAAASLGAPAGDHGSRSAIPSARLLAITVLLFTLALCFESWTRPVPARPEPPPPPPPPAGLRLGVVRLQEVVNAYDRYIYVTARFTEIYRTHAAEDFDQLERMETASKADVPTDSVPELLLDHARFEAYLGTQRELMQGHVAALSRALADHRLKSDLNAVLEFEIQEDICAILAAIAQHHDLDAVTAWAPVTEFVDEEESQLHFQAVRSRMPVIYADPALDVTAEAIRELNAQYAARYGAAPRSDPLLTNDLDAIAATIATQAAAGRQALAGRTAATPPAPSRRRPILHKPHHASDPCAVVQLDRIAAELFKNTGVHLYFQALTNELNDTQMAASASSQRYSALDRNLRRLIDQGSPVTRAQIDELVLAWARSQADNREFVLCRAGYNGWIRHYEFKAYSAILDEVTRQAQARGIRLVFAVHLADPHSDTVDTVTENAVAWHRAAPPLDLTMPVLQALIHPNSPPTTTVPSGPADHSQSPSAAMPIPPAPLPPERDPYELDADPRRWLEHFHQKREAQATQRQAEDRRQFEAWHRYQREVLHAAPSAP